MTFPEDTRDPPRRAPRWGYVLVLLLVLSFAAGLWFLPRLWQTPQPGPVTTAEPEPGAVGRPFPADAPRAARPQPRRVEPEPAHTAPDNAGQLPAEAPVFGRVVVRCVTTEGLTAAGVPILVRFAGHTATGPDNAAGILTTDENGQCNLPNALGNTLRLEPGDGPWYWDPVEVAGTRPGIVTIAVAPTRTIKVHAIYDDGVPVTYMGSFHSTDMVSYSVSFALSSDGTAEVPRIPINQPLYCLVYAQQRAGYPRHRVLVSPHELESGLLNIVVSRAPPTRGNIRILLQQPAPAGTSVLLELEGDTPTSDNFRGQTDRWDSGPLRPGRWRVTLVGALAWRSDWLEVRAGEITQVRPVPAPAGSARARLLDSAGLPLSGGILGIDTGRYFGFDGPTQPRAGGADIAFSDDSGVVLLPNLPAGSLTFRAEGWACEPTFRTAHIEPGTVTDLGDIRLGHAAGMIHVRVTGMKPDLKYVCIILQPGLGQLRPDLPVESETTTLRDLPLRTYRVGVTLAKSGTIVAQTVELTSSSPEVTILIDASNVRP